MTHTGLVGDAALLVVAGVAAPLLGGPVVRHEGCVTLLTELVLTHDLVLPHSLRHLIRVRVINNQLSIGISC